MRLVDDTYKSNPSLYRSAIITVIVSQLQLKAAHLFRQAFHLYQQADRETLQRLLVQVECLTEEVRSLKLQLGDDRRDDGDAVKRGV